LTRYEYICHSKKRGTGYFKGVFVTELDDIEEIRREILAHVAEMVQMSGAPFDPFNATLMIVKSDAQPQP